MHTGDTESLNVCRKKHQSPIRQTLRPELEKAGSMGSAEPDFFLQILRELVPFFHNDITKFYQALIFFCNI